MILSTFEETVAYICSMETKVLIKEIQRLPINKRMMVIEQTLKSIRESELKKKMEKGVNSLLNDYKTDKELTTFTDIDFDNFYETR